MGKEIIKEEVKQYIPHVGKFNFPEMFNNVVNGKTSITKFCGFLLIVTACIGFTYGTYKGSDQNIFLTASAFAGLGSSLLLGKVLTKDSPLPKINSVEDAKKVVEEVVNQEKI